MPRITLVGYRGTGKSTVAALLADRLGCPWIDADAVLEERVGLSIARLVGERGEPAFRDAESAVLRDLVGMADVVLATGGGVILRPENRALLRRQARPVAWLTAPAETIRRRLASDPATMGRRPALAGSDPLAEVGAALAAREPLYREVADAAFATDAASSDQVAATIHGWLEGWRAGHPQPGGMP